MYLLLFLICIGFYMINMAVEHVYPFGSRSFLYQDACDQYPGILKIFLEWLHSGDKGSFIWERGLGIDIVLNMFKFDVPPADPGTSLVSLSDRNLKTVYRADKPLDIVVPNLDNPKATKVIVVGSAAFAIQARRGEGAWTPVGKRNAGPGVSEFAIPAGTSAVRLTYKAPQPEAIINEVIFSSRK